MSRAGRWIVATGAAMLVTCAGLLLGAGAANAYTLLGPKWSSANINFTNYTSGLYATASNAAVLDWSANTDANLFSGSGNPLTISTTYNSSTPGVTNYTANASGTFLTAKVYGNTYFMAGYSANCKRMVFGHELGHALGLNHNNALPYKLMYGDVIACTSGGVYSTQTDDRNGVNFLY